MYIFFNDFCSHAKQKGVDLSVFDSEEELMKIKSIFPETRQECSAHINSSNYLPAYAVVLLCMIICTVLLY